MSKFNLSRDEVKEITDIANNLIGELNLLSMDIIVLKEQVENMGFFEKRKPGGKELYDALSKSLYEKLEVADSLNKKIEAYKEILGIKKKKRLLKTRH